MFSHDFQKYAFLLAVALTVLLANNKYFYRTVNNLKLAKEQHKKYIFIFCF